VHLDWGGRPEEHGRALEDGDEPDGDEEAVDEVVAGEAEEGLVGEIAGGGRDEAGGDHRHRIGQPAALGEGVGRVGADHHELAESKVHDARDAEGESDPERDDAVHGADDGAVQHLTKNQLRHAQAADKGPSASLAPSAARSTYREYASRATFGRRL